MGLYRSLWTLPHTLRRLQPCEACVGVPIRLMVHHISPPDPRSVHVCTKDPERPQHLSNED